MHFGLCGMIKRLASQEGLLSIYKFTFYYLKPLEPEVFWIPKFVNIRKAKWDNTNPLPNPGQHPQIKHIPTSAKEYINNSPEWDK